jgi:pimeloyl-ACP methyl ester carboxylesterase
MIESVIKELRVVVARQAAAVRQRMRILPDGVWISALVIAAVGGRYAWMHAGRPEHGQEIAAAYGSTRLLYGLPQTDHAGKQLTFVATSDKGYAVFLVDTATGHKTNVHEGTLGGGSHDQCDLQVWPWSPDDKVFLYSESGQVSVCDAQTGRVISVLATLGPVSDLTWLTPALLVCVEADGSLYQFEKQSDGGWHQKPPADSVNGLRLRSIGGAATASDGNEAAVSWRQYQFSGPAWAITQYTLAGSTNDGALNPRDWQLLASNDGSRWTVLDNRSNEVFNSRGQTKIYTFSNETPYWFYRLSIQANSSGIGTNACLTNFQLWSADSPSEISASSENAPTWSAYMAFDGASDTKWWNDNGGSAGWLQYQFGGGAGWAVSRYALTSADNNPKRDPRAWRILASNNGHDWIGLDSRSDENFSDRLQTQRYQFDNATPYRFYRLDISDNHGLDAGGLQVAEWDLKASAKNTSSVTASISVARNPLAGTFSLSATSSNSIIYGQGNRIWSLNLESNSPELVLDLSAAGSANLVLRSFSYSQRKGELLLNCSQEGKGQLWRFNPQAGKSGASPINLPVAVHSAVWLNGSNEDGWIGNGNKFLLAAWHSGSDPERLLARANIDSFTVTPDGRQCFFFGTASNEPSADIWQYDLEANQTRCVIPYADYPSPYASRLGHGSGVLRLPSGEELRYDIFRPVHYDRLQHHKYPLLIGDTYFGNVVNGGHGRLWIPAVAANDAFVVIVNRRDWANGIEHWGEDVMAVYNQLVENSSIDKDRAFLFGVSLETRYLSEYVAQFPGLWKGIILLNPTGLPDFSKSPLNQPRPKLLLSAGGEEGEGDYFSEYQATALKSGVLVEYVISPGEGHHFVGNAAQLQRTRALEDFIFEE